MKKFTQRDFTFEEDEAVSGSCENCGCITDNNDALENGECPECWSTLLITTKHEDCECFICKCHIDMWTDVYKHNKEDEIMICENCYNELKELEIKDVLKKAANNKAKVHLVLYDVGAGDVIVQKVNAEGIVVDFIEDTWTTCYPYQTMEFTDNNIEYDLIAEVQII